MISRLGLMAAGVLFAGAALADDGATEEEVAALLTAMEEGGCFVNTQNMHEVLAASGLSDERAGAALIAMRAQGLATSRYDGISVVNPYCDVLFFSGRAGPNLD